MSGIGMTMKDHDDEDCLQGLTRLTCTESILYLWAVSTNSSIRDGWGGGGRGGRYEWFIPSAPTRKDRSKEIISH